MSRPFLICALYFLMFCTIDHSAQPFFPCNGQWVINNQSANCSDDPWILILEDDFWGSTINTTKWNAHEGAVPGSNSVKPEYYAPENCVMSNDGILRLQVKHSPYWGLVDQYLPPGEIMDTEPPHDALPNYRQFEYSSGWLDSRYLYDYGRFEIRCKLPAGKGFWPAFWLQWAKNNPDPMEDEYNEIDVFEFWRNDYSDQCMTIHNDMSTSHGSSGGGCQYCYDSGVDYSAAMHTFTIEWSPTEIVFYTDGVQRRIYPRFYAYLPPFFLPADCQLLGTGGLLAEELAYPDDPMMIRVNAGIDVLDNGIYLPDANTVFPNNMEVDYIKCWVKSPCSGNVVINNFSEFDLSDNTGWEATKYNIKTGGMIETLGVMTIPEFNQLELRASQSITLNPGFYAEKKVDCVLLHIDQGLCISDARLDASVQSQAVSQEHPVLEKIQILPNPNDGKFQVRSPGMISSVELFDEIGKKVLSVSGIFENSYAIDIADLPQGLYFIKVQDTLAKTYFEKLVINK